LFSLEKRKLWDDLISVQSSLMGGCREDKARLLKVCGSWTGCHRHKLEHRKFWSDRRKKIMSVVDIGAGSREVRESQSLPLPGPRSTQLVSFCLCPSMQAFLLNYL